MNAMNIAGFTAERSRMASTPVSRRRSPQQRFAGLIATSDPTNPPHTISRLYRRGPAEEAVAGGRREPGDSALPNSDHMLDRARRTCHLASEERPSAGPVDSSTAMSEHDPSHCRIDPIS